jgi:GNAT superfamily N-acetyltransferase
VIRVATTEDFAPLLTMGREFYDASGYSDLVGFDRESLVRTFEQLMQNGGLFVAEVNGEVVGMVGGMVYPFYFDADHLTGQEVFWWVMPEHRKGRIGLELLQALEEWAKARGAKSLSMVSLDRLNPEQVARMYSAAGYRASEHTFIKRL